MRIASFSAAQPPKLSKSAPQFGLKKAQLNQLEALVAEKTVLLGNQIAVTGITPASKENKSIVAEFRVTLPLPRRKKVEIDPSIPKRSEAYTKAVKAATPKQEYRNGSLVISRNGNPELTYTLNIDGATIVLSPEQLSVSEPGVRLEERRQSLNGTASGLQTALDQLVTKLRLTEQVNGLKKRK